MTTSDPNPNPDQGPTPPADDPPRSQSTPLEPSEIETKQNASDQSTWGPPKHRKLDNDKVERPKTFQRTPMSGWLALALLVWTVLADWLIFRTHGYSGPALFFTLAPFFFLLRNVATNRIATTICTLALWLAAIRLATLGSGWVIASAVLLLFAVALSTSNVVPWAFETIAMTFRSFIDGIAFLTKSRFPSLSRPVVSGPPGGQTVVAGSSLTWALPLGASLVFGGVFIAANPDLVTWVFDRYDLFSTWVWRWTSQLSAWEVPFCVLALLLAAGLFCPSWGRKRIGGLDDLAPITTNASDPLYLAFRNTLICLIALFSVYLVFEFQTLWKRDFPEGFYYAGYAHQGAAWLTIALALATGLLSIIFRQTILGDQRVGRLKVLAYAWAATNFLLAVAVVNRLGIYVGYNGLTPMRIVGYFGTTTVVVGFVLVLAKIHWRKGFWWLIRTQTTALLAALIALTLFPVDYVSHRYNAWQVRQGYLPPSVMIAVKPKDDLGYLPLLELVDCEDPIIREGVLALLATRQLAIETETEQETWHWTKNQQATRVLYQRMVELESLWKPYRDSAYERSLAINRFEDYSMPWY